MTLSGRGFAKIFVIAAVLILAVIIFLNIYLDRKIAREAPSLIENFSVQSGYSIEVRDIGIDPLFNLRLNGVSVKAPSLEGAEVAQIEKLVIDPSIFSSLFQRKVVVNEILAESAEISATMENIDNLIEVVKKLDSGERDEPSRVQIRNFRLKDAVFNISPKTSVSSESLNVGIENGSGNETTVIDLLGELNVLDTRLEIAGGLNKKPGTAEGFLELNADGIGSKKLKFLSESGDLEAEARINFELSDVLSADGIINLRAGGSILTKPEPIVTLDCGLNYNQSNKTAVLDKLNLKVKGLLDAGFGGTAEIKDGDVAVNISGSARAQDLGQLKNIVPSMKTDEITGSAELKDLKLTGSTQKGGFALKGEVLIRDASYKKTEDELEVSGLDCGLKLDQDLSPGAGFKMRTSGSCAADTFDWPKTGQAKAITSDVEISSADNFSQTDISLTDLNGSFMEGTLSGSLGFDFSGGVFGLSGLLTGRNINLKEAPKSIIPFDIEGTGETITGEFEGGSGEYAADISFTARDFLVRFGSERELKLSEVKSVEDLTLHYKSNKDQDNEKGTKDSISIKSTGLSYEDLSFGEYLIENGRVNELSFLLAIESDWTLNLASEGRGFEVLGKSITLDRFNESLSIERSGREGFSGRVNGEGGKFKSIEFPALEWDYKYRSGFVELSKLKADIGAIGRFETDDLTLRLGNNGSYPIVSKFKGSVFTGLDGKVYTDSLSGDLTINDPNSDEAEWDGNIEAEKLEIVSQTVHNIRLDVMPTDKGLVLKNISGTLLKGALSGQTDVDTTGPRARIVSDIVLTGAELKQEAMSINIARTEFDFTGLLPQSSLPEGAGEVKLDGITITKDGKSYNYRAGLSGKTEGETLSIEKGFISDRDSRELSFTAKMMDSLNENRQLKLNMPGIQIPTAIGVLEPFVPDTLSQAKTRGQADLELVFYNLFYPGQSWGGKLGVLRGEYYGTLSGTELVVKDIYGTVTIKDDADTVNPLSSFMPGQLKLSKSIYKKFLNSIKGFTASEDSDYLKIGLLQYGIIKIENIDASLEVDREEINLKKITSKAFRGGLYGTGIYKFKEPGSYNISFLFDEISLEAISKSISTEREYITGRVNGLAWITGEGGSINTIDGPFMFWATNSSKEPRRIGEALLNKLGARERLILGSSRGYDSGEISGYINDGVITFRVFRISNSVLGFRNLDIRADQRQNSISINHLISVIRELARRSLTGGPTIETN